MTPEKSDVLKAMQMIYDTFEMNSINPNCGFSACFNMTANMMEVRGISEELIKKYLDAMLECTKSVGAGYIREDL